MRVRQYERCVCEDSQRESRRRRRLGERGGSRGYVRRENAPEKGKGKERENV